MQIKLHKWLLLVSERKRADFHHQGDITNGFIRAPQTACDKSWVVIRLKTPDHPLFFPFLCWDYYDERTRATPEEMRLDFDKAAVRFSLMSPQAGWSGDRQEARTIRYISDSSKTQRVLISELNNHEILYACIRQ